MRKLTLTEVINKANNVHNNIYDYSLVEYRGYSEKVKILCQLHGEFTMTVSNHLSGKGCRKCGCQRLAMIRKNTLEEFLAKVISVHGNTYDYSKVVYKNLLTNVIVTCREHGDFPIRPGNHMFGKGCPKCAKYGFRVDRPANFYILKSGNITKVGITNRKVSERVQGINKGPYSFTIVEALPLPGQQSKDLETQVLSYLRSQYLQPTDKFDGSTECFYDVDLDDLTQFLDRCNH